MAEFQLPKPGKSLTVGEQKFLNVVESDHSGAMKWQVTVKGVRSKAKRPRKPKFTFWGTIIIRDCNRQIDLCLDGGTRSRLAIGRLMNTKAKLQNMIGMLQGVLEVVDALLDSCGENV